MDVISFLIGLVLGLIGLSMSRLKWVFRGLLAGGTSQLILSIGANDAHLWSLEEYTWDNLMNLVCSPFFIWCLLWWSVSMLIFYWILLLGLERFTRNKLETKFKKIHDELSKQELRFLQRLFYKFISKLFSVANKIGMMRPHSKMVEDDSVSYNEISDTIYLTFCTFLHTLSCFIFILKVNQWWLYGIFAIVVLLLLIGIFISPIFLFFNATINNIVATEHNKYVR